MAIIYSKLKSNIPEPGTPPKPRQLQEEKLFPPLKKYFNDLDHKVYTEVAWGSSRIADIITEKDGQFFAVEMKMTLSCKVVQQAYLNTLCSHYSYVAVPTKPKNSGIENCKSKGLGILIVKDGVVERLVESKLHDPNKHWIPDFTNWEEGVSAGTPNLKGQGPTYEVLDRIKQYVRQHPKASWKEIYMNVLNHYSSHHNLCSSMSRWRGFNLTEFKKGLQCQS